MAQKTGSLKQELQSLVDYLSHATTVAQHGRTFLRRMVDLTKQARQPHHHIRLSEEFRSDLQWWATFLPKWNGKSMLRQPELVYAVTADASGSWSCGAFGSNGSWFQVQWPGSWTQHQIVQRRWCQSCWVWYCGEESDRHPQS